MAARRGKKRVRRRKTFSITNALFSLGYANILSSGLFGTNIISFFTGSYTPSTGNYAPGFVYGSGIGIKELIQDPQSLQQVVSNAGENLVPMLTQSLVLGVTERLFKSVMRRPLSNVNRNLVKPMLGAGVRL
jgi:hypothetical protein